MSSFFFFFNDPPPTEIYTLSLHDALPICVQREGRTAQARRVVRRAVQRRAVRRFRAAAQERCRREGVEEVHHAQRRREDRKSTRLNSSHPSISYAVFCLKKKKKSTQINE